MEFLSRGRASNSEAARCSERIADLEHVFRISPVGLAVHDREGRLVRINERLAAIDGLSVDEHIGHRIGELLPAVGAKVDPIVQRVLETGESALDLEITVPNPVAPLSQFVGLVNFHPLKSPDGAVDAVSVAVVDITERKRLEQSLRTRERQLSGILDSAMDAMVVIDEGGSVATFNGAAERMFRCTAGEALGRPFQRFTPEGFGASFGRWLAQACGSRTPARRALCRSGGEEFTVEITVSRVDAGGQTLYAVALRELGDPRAPQARCLPIGRSGRSVESGADTDAVEIVGASEAMKRVLGAADQVARTDSTVMITGETGTGKELIAKTIHEGSARRSAALVKVNCAALPGALIESELFGHEKGAFTGALARKAGRFELADGGTIFLDEIGDLPLELQAKLLRVLQDGELERIGGTQTLHVDVRVIAATNRDLAGAVSSQRFRADLFYRLHVFPIHLPPLRERRDDISLLVRHFVATLGRKLGRPIQTIPKEALDRLVAHDWAGNVRELRNVIERAMILGAGPELELGDWSAPETKGGAGQERTATLAELERGHILEALQRMGWRVSGPRGAARLLGVKPTTLEARMKKHGIVRPAR